MAGSLLIKAASLLLLAIPFSHAAPTKQPSGVAPLAPQTRDILHPRQIIDGEKYCSANVGMAVLGTDRADISVQLINEEGAEMNSWRGEMAFQDSVSLGGLGPEVAWTLVPADGTLGTMNLEFWYDVEYFVYLTCWITEDLEQGAGTERRTCAFLCHG